MAPAGAAVPGLQTGFPACTWGCNSLASSTLACAQPQCRKRLGKQQHLLAVQAHLEISHGHWWEQGRNHSPFPPLPQPSTAPCTSCVSRCNIVYKMDIGKIFRSTIQFWYTRGSPTNSMCFLLCFLFKYCPPHPISSMLIIANDLLHDIPLSSSIAFLLSDAHCKLL